MGIIEKDTRNVYEWDTSTVAPGIRFGHESTNLPEKENSGLQFIEFSPGILKWLIPASIHPAVFITRPGTPVAIAQEIIGRIRRIRPTNLRSRRRGSAKQF